MPRQTLPFGDIIAERRLKPRGQSQGSVVVTLGIPRLTGDPDHWECPFRISGAAIRHVDCGHGVDAFQSLALALEGIRRFLDRLDTPLVWDGVFDDHSGFQRAIPYIPAPRRATGCRLETEPCAWSESSTARCVSGRRR